MAKTPEERPEVPSNGAAAAKREPQYEDAPSVTIDGKTVRYNPSPGYRLLVAGVTDYGDKLPKLRFVTCLPSEPGRTDQAEYLLSSAKPPKAHHTDWWREATPEEMAAYQEEAGAFGLGAVAKPLRKNWLGRHPEYHEGAPAPPTSEGEKVLARLAEALEKREKEQR